LLIEMSFHEYRPYHMLVAERG